MSDLTLKVKEWRGKQNWKTRFWWIAWASLQCNLNVIRKSNGQIEKYIVYSQFGTSMSTRWIKSIDTLYWHFNEPTLARIGGNVWVQASLGESSLEQGQSCSSKIVTECVVSSEKQGKWDFFSLHWLTTGLQPRHVFKGLYQPKWLFIDKASIFSFFKFILNLFFYNFF